MFLNIIVGFNISLNVGFLVSKCSFFVEKSKSVVRNTDNPGHHSLQTHVLSQGSTFLPEGVVHIYRHTRNYNQNIATFVNDHDRREEDQDSSTTEFEKPLKLDTVKVEDSNDGTTLAVLAVPSYMTPVDFMTFIAPASESVAHLRMIR